MLITLNDTPRVLACSHHLVSDFDEVIRTDDGKRHVGVHSLVGLGHGLVVERELVDLDAVVVQLRHDLGLELGQLGLVDRVGLCDDGNDIHLGVELLHAHEVDGLEAVAVRRNKVEAGMDPGVVVDGQVALDFQLLLEILLVLVVDVVDNRLEAVLLVHLVAVTDRVAERQLQLDVGLLELVGVRAEPHVRLSMVGRIGLEVGIEQGVHQGGLPEAGLADAHDVEGEARGHGLVDELVGQRVETDMASQGKGSDTATPVRVGRLQELKVTMISLFS